MHNQLIIRLGAMGDIIHALPAAATLKRSFPERRLFWLVTPRWIPLLEGNPYIDALIPFERARLRSWRTLGRLNPDVAVDLQGLIVSAFAARITRPKRLFGFTRSVAREPLASLLYSDRIPVTGPHRVERNLQLVAAAGATSVTQEAWIPPGKAENKLPSRPFVLASPFAGWAGKQWPLTAYEELALLLDCEGFSLVLNVPSARVPELAPFRHLVVHSSSLAGLIYATRRASGVVGVDSGPLHLAAALAKSGVALFGPTDPGQTGPFGTSMIVLRAHGVETTYKRHKETHYSMEEITPRQVADALLTSLSEKRAPLTTL